MITVFILAKNEEPNLRRCLEGMSRSGWPITVLDSGSTDGTRAICSEFPGVRVEEYRYSNHLAAYNEITSRRVPSGDYALVLDADMRVSEALRAEIVELLEAKVERVLRSPVEMWWCGVPLLRGSLYPPKAIVFPGGFTYFEPCGNGEKLRRGVTVRSTRARLVHDDRKPFAEYLKNQVRYGDELLQRSRNRELSFRDRIRTLTPLLLVIAPVYSWVFRLGCFSGRVGWVYALDRLIAEAIQYRQVVAAGLSREQEGLPSGR